MPRRHGSGGLVTDGAVRHVSKLLFGLELFPSLNFTSSWLWINSPTNVTQNSFTTSGGGGMRYNNILTVGKTYEVKIALSTTSVGGVDIFTETPSAVALNGVPLTVRIVSNGTGFFYLRNKGAGVTTVTSLSVREVL